MAGRLEGKVALVTGGASGIGRACAVRFAEEGADVCIGDLNPDRGKETLALVEELGRRAIVVETNTADEQSCEALAQACVDEFGRLDVVLAAAGISHAGYVSGGKSSGIGSAPLLDKPADDWRRVLEVNLTGVMLTDRAAARRMIALGNGGSIINIASGAAKIAIPGAGEYSVSKAGVWMLTKVLSLELAASKIRVNAIGPGFIDTPMTQAISTSEAFLSGLEARTPLSRIGQPLDIANTALFLASDESSFYTGSILFPDGGLDAGSR
jgi:NAD(P)-dependent dehydrogenase (short-subunit alcohol dehydrogenase family)